MSKRDRSPASLSDTPTSLPAEQTASPFRPTYHTVRRTLSRPTGPNEDLTMLAMAWHAITVSHPPPHISLNQFPHLHQTLTTRLQTLNPTTPP